VNWCLLETRAVAATSVFPCSLFLPLLQVPRRERERERWLFYEEEEEEREGDALLCPEFTVGKVQRRARVYGGRFGCFAWMLLVSGCFLGEPTRHRATCHHAVATGVSRRHTHADQQNVLDYPGLALGLRAPA
jgi:hypothetical protein